MKKVLSPQVMRLLLRISRLAQSKKGVRVYLVGGIVRDLLRGVRCDDIDIVVEPAAIPFARALAMAIGGTLVTYPRFGTATVVVADRRIRIDCATARTEIYPMPGTLPRVQEGRIREDLFRRDFTINAMAVGLNADNQGQLIDPFSGREDLGRGIVRVLHRRSFSDDPTRAVRAIRFVHRFRFRLERCTAAYLRTAVRSGMFAAISGERVRHELVRLCGETDPAGALERLGAWGILRAVHPGLRVDRYARRTLRDLARGIRFVRAHDASPLQDTWILYLASVSNALSPAHVPAMAERLSLTAKERAIVLTHLRLSGKIRHSSGTRREFRSVVHDLLSGPVRPHACALIWAGGSPRQRQCLAVMYRRAQREPLVTGTDLLRAGMSPGPAFGAVLARVRAAQIDGTVRTRAAALRYARGERNGSSPLTTEAMCHDERKKSRRP